MIPALSVVVTFHAEELFAHASLWSILQARQAALHAGHAVELVFVLDFAQAATSRVVKNHPALQGDERMLLTEHGDPGLARNTGVEVASAPWVCTLDGDDLVSLNYFLQHIDAMQGAAPNLVLHPEWVICFGKERRCTQQIDQRSAEFSVDMLLQHNPWVSAVCARKDTFRSIPYRGCKPQSTGFGYEDWHWNCETLAAGCQHHTVGGAAYFYRLKEQGSVNAASNALEVIMPPSALFGRWEPTL